MSDAVVTAIYCCTCGCPRSPFTHPCPDCRDWPFGIEPNPQYAGWQQRQQVTVVQGELFHEDQQEGSYRDGY